MIRLLPKGATAPIHASIHEVIEKYGAMTVLLAVLRAMLASRTDRSTSADALPPYLRRDVGLRPRHHPDDRYKLPPRPPPHLW